MTIWKYLFEGLRLAALFGTVSLVVWSMPEQAQGVPALTTGIAR